MGDNDISPSTPQKKSWGSRLSKITPKGLGLRKSSGKNDTGSAQITSASASPSGSVSSFMTSPQTSGAQSGSSPKPQKAKRVEKAGLWAWPDDGKDEPGTVDIVAVHGLQGDWQVTWEQDRKIWLRDFLGKKIDNIQVLSFGYNSVINFEGWTHQLEDFSNQLLQAVTIYRRDSERKLNRPIIFLGHSLGGLIIKKALILAHAREKLYSNILDHTKGLVFMGTPHRGSNAAKFARILEFSLGTIGSGPNTDLFKDLEEKSRTLMQINKEFPERGSILKIISFREMLPISPLKSLVVDENSAFLGWDNEEPIDLNENHRSMCKFGQEDTKAFEAVWKPIWNLVKTVREGTTASVKQEKRKILEALYSLSSTNSRKTSPAESVSVEPAKGTCKWILAHDDYVRWQNPSLKPNILWITGGPGSGKSVLAGFVATALEKNALVCRFSFTAGKFGLLDLFIQVIAQALEKNNELYHWAAKYRETTDWIKSWEDLFSFWSRLCEESKGVQVFWVIDALDECSEPERVKDFLGSMTALLRKLESVAAKDTKRTYFHILFTSRPEVWQEVTLPSMSEAPDISVSKRLILEDQVGIEEDIRTYIHEEVESFATTCTQENRDKLEARLCEGAEGSFLWPQLTLASIRTELDDEDGWEEILSAIPKTLEDIYEKLLSQLAGVRRSQRIADYRSLPPKITQIFQCVVAAHGILTEEELNTMIILLKEPHPMAVTNVEVEAQRSAQSVQRVYGSFLRRIRGSDGVQNVRLFHDTARRHLLLPGSTSKYAMRLEDCHLSLAKACVAYLHLHDFDEMVTRTEMSTSEKHPLLNYACLNWATHVREADGVMEDNPTLFEDIQDMYRTNSQRFLSWSRAYWQFSSLGTGKMTGTPLQMCAYNGHVRILQRLLAVLDDKDRQAETDKGDVEGNTALHYAVESDRPAAVEALVENGTKPSLRNKAGLSALHCGVISNRRDASDALLRSGADVDIKTGGDKPGRTALHLAAEAGLRSMVELLLQHRANTEMLCPSVSQGTSTAADLAFIGGHGDICKLLLSKEVNYGNTDLDRAVIDGNLSEVISLVEGGASLVTTDHQGSTPFHRAARGTNESIFIYLLGRTSNTDIRDDDGMTPLHLAARYGRREIVERLIAKGADIDAVSADQSTPLHEAALAGHNRVVDRLLDAKADQSIKDSSHRTPLFCAASLGFRDIVESFLTKAKTSKFEDIPDDKGRLPIHIASENGHKSTVETLLSRSNQGTEIVDQRGRTLLSLAASGPSKQHSETVLFLVKEGAALDHKQCDGATPLLLAAKTGNVQSMKYLLGEDCSKPGKTASNVEERDSSRSTPLSLAAAGGHERAVLLLLEHGARDVSKTEKPGTRDPLSWAAGYGMLEVVKRLLKMPGISIDSLDENLRTPLSWAAGNGHSATVLKLLAPSFQGARPESNSDEIEDHMPGSHDAPAMEMLKSDINSVDSQKRTPLSRAAEAGHNDVVKLLLAHGADQTIKDLDGSAPILWAAWAGHNEVLSTLFRHNPPEETIFNEARDTALAKAAWNGKIETVSFLIDISNPGVNRSNKQGKTPLLYASNQGHEDVVRILVANGANVHAIASDSGDTALTLAAKEGSVTVVQILIKHDSSTLAARNNAGETPLYLACKHGHYEIVKLLLKSGCNIEESRSKSGNSLVHVASEHGHFLLLELLLKKSTSSLFDVNDNGETPLMLAAVKGHEAVVDVILKCCKKQNIDLKNLIKPDYADRSMLSAAAQGGAKNILLSILDIEGDEEIGRIDRKGLSPILYAMSGNKSSAVRLLLSRCPQSINQRNPQDLLTPLLWTASYGDQEVILVLLASSHLERYARDKKGRTSLWLAVTNGHLEIVRLLLQDNSGSSELRKLWLKEMDIETNKTNTSPLQAAVLGGYPDIVDLLLDEADLDVNLRSPDGLTAFLTAIKSGDEFLVRTLAANRSVDTDIRDYSGQTALMLACKHDHFRVVRYLLKEHRPPILRVDDTDKAGMTALCHAAKSGTDPAIVKLLLDRNASVHQRVPPLDRNPLMLASQFGNFSIFKELSRANTQEGIPIDATDRAGYTALTIAAIENRSTIVRFLLREGANPNVRSRRSKRTPVMEAAYYGCAAAVRELLLSPKTDFTCVNDADRTATWFLINGPPDPKNAIRVNLRQSFSIAETFLEFEQEKLNINEIDVEGHTPLLLLANQNNHLTLRHLLELGADFKYQSKATGSSAFHEAAKCIQPSSLNELLEIDIKNEAIDLKDLDNATPLSYASGNLNGALLSKQTAEKIQLARYRMVRMLLDRGAEVNSCTIEEKRTPLMFAASLGWDKIVGLLLEKKAKADLQDRNYSTPLFLAVERGHLATVQRLLGFKASHTGKDKTGATLAIIAAKSGHLGLVKLFFGHYKANVNDNDRSGRTALSHATEQNRTDVIYYLLDHNQNSDTDIIESRDRNDQTPLLWACKKGRCNALQTLIDHGADFRCKDRNQRMPLSHAAGNGHTYIVRQLLEYEDADRVSEILDWQDSSGRTALSWAAEEGHSRVVQVLLDWGADALLNDHKRWTPRLFALDNAHTTVVNVLNVYEVEARNAGKKASIGDSRRDGVDESTHDHE